MKTLIAICLTTLFSFSANAGTCRLSKWLGPDAPAKFKKAHEVEVYYGRDYADCVRIGKVTAKGAANKSVREKDPYRAYYFVSVKVTYRDHIFAAPQTQWLAAELSDDPADYRP